MKKLVALLLALCSVFACGASAACFGGDNSASDVSSVEESSSKIEESSLEESSSEEESSSSEESSSKSEDDITPAYTREGDYIWFGSYPQTKVVDSALVSTLNAQAGTLPTSANSHDWTSYDYYIESSNATDYMWYQDETYGGEKYRGVYFTSYRSYRTDFSNSSTYQDDNGYTTSMSYWFKYEPIEWRILSESDGTALILCEMLIDSQEYRHNYNNNYAESSIRAWLNNNFYNTAFNDLQKALIEKTTVDNSAATTNSAGNPYACENTVDNIFLLSYQDVLNTSYGFSSNYSTHDEARQKKATDYAQCQGVHTERSGTYAGNGDWWLRSPCSTQDLSVYYVLYVGHSNNLSDASYTSYGVCPALKIRLS